MFINVSIILFAYLLGSVSSAILVCKLFDFNDPRTAGSGNPGATNVMRLHGKKVGLLILTSDILKGLLPVFMAKAIDCSELIIVLAGLATFLGHLFPLFFKFKGGKGVATFIGILFATHWPLGLIYIATWLLIALLSRYSSLSALIATSLTPFYSWYMLHDIHFLVSYLLMGLMLIWRHRSNILKLIAGTENKIGKKQT